MESDEENITKKLKRKNKNFSLPPAPAINLTPNRNMSGEADLLELCLTVNSNETAEQICENTLAFQNYDGAPTFSSPCQSEEQHFIRSVQSSNTNLLQPEKSNFVQATSSHTEVTRKYLKRFLLNLNFPFFNI